MATLSEPINNKPTLSKLDAFSIFNGKHSAVYINLGFSNRQPPEVLIHGFHPMSQSAEFYIPSGKENLFKYEFQKCPIYSCKCTFSGMDGKTIGYYPAERSSNDGGGNLKSMAINPKNMQDFFSICEFKDDTDYYVILPNLSFYSSIICPEMLEKVINHDFSKIPDMNESNNKVHIFVDTNSFFNICRFECKNDDPVLSSLLEMDLGVNIHSYLRKSPSKFGVLWIYNIITKGYNLHLSLDDSNIMPMATQYAFGIKSGDNQVAFNEFITLDSTELVIDCDTSNSNLSVTPRSNGRINISTNSSGFDDVWVMALIPNDVKTVKFLGSEISIRSPTELELKELDNTNIEASLDLYQTSQEISEVPDEASREDKNAMLMKNANKIVEIMFCKNTSSKKKVRFDKDKEIHPYKKFSKSLWNSAQSTFYSEINRISENSSSQIYRHEPPMVERQMSCGVQKYPYSHPSLERY